MGRFLRGLGGLVAATLVTVSTAWAQNADPPGRVGRIAFINGTVSFHDRDETNWAPAAINYPLTSGDALWTEPNGRVEVYVGSTRLRMQGSTQLETLALTDEEFRLRLSQGRLDAKTAGLQQGQQVEILTPRATVALVGDGDYMIEAGTTDDATRVGVRVGSARVIAPNGTELVVRAGEIGVLTGTSPPVFETLRMATPPMPPEWAPRDRRVATSQSAQYVPPGVTGIEELDYHGSWSVVGDYGRVWSPRTVPAGWAPYRQGRWRWVDPWGWTWVDDQPWGFAPSHYGRWVNNGGRWYWVPPQRQTRPVYAPAVVGFVDIAAAGAALAIGAAAGAPVGWFPLGPREVYVPPYTANRTYIRNINVTNVINVGVIDSRIEYIERRRDPRFRDDRRDDGRRDDPRARDDRRDGRPGDDRDRPTFVNQRYTIVVPQQAFVRGERADRAAIRVEQDRIARAQVAPVAAPPVASATPPPAAPGAAPAKPDADPKTPAAPAQPAAQPRADVQRAPLADTPVLGRPARQDRPTATAPGPQISRTQPAGQAAPGTTAPPAERQLPSLRTRDGRESDRATPAQAAPAKPGEPPVAAPPAKPGESPKPGDRPVAAPAKPDDDPAKPAQAAPAPPPAPGKPGDPPKAAEPPKPPVTPPKAAEPPKPPATPPKAAEPPKPPAIPPKAAEPPKPPATPPKAAEPPKPPATPPKAAEPPKPPVTPPNAAEPPKPPATPPKAAEPPKPPVTPPNAAEPPKPPATPPKAAEPPKPPATPPKAAEPPKPPAPQAKPPEPPRPAPQAPPPPVQAKPAAPPPPPPPPVQAKPAAVPPPPPAPAPVQAKPPAPPAPPPQAKPPEPPKPPGRDRDDKGGDDRRR